MKINLEVIAKFDVNGNIRPVSIVWEDGRVFPVDRILDIRKAASLKAGGLGMRYICRICRGKRWLSYTQGSIFFSFLNSVTLGKSG